jgi:hypothetical protein
MPDLNTIPGFAALQSLTLGDPRIKIAVLDGPADFDRACFQGANLSRVKPYWQTDLELIDPFYIQQELKIRDLSNQKKALKKTLKECEKQEAATATSPPSNETVAQIPPAIAAVTPSVSERSPSPYTILTTTIFNAVLEDINAVSFTG